jgi:thymidylate synthase (FAD)
MNKIEVRVLNPDVVKNCEKMMVCGARLTQKGHKIKSMNDFMALYDKPYAPQTAEIMAHLPHPTIQKFGVINVVVVGASRRFLAQITRHQNEIKFMSASLQYSDYSDDADFVVPYDLLDKPDLRECYLKSCKESMETYQALDLSGIDHDECGYAAPQGLRNILIMSATPFEFKHIISQRTCKRNTKETIFVMLKVWEELYKLNPTLFAPDTTGPFCMKEGCKEGKMSCGVPLEKGITPSERLRKEFPLIYEDKPD